MICLSMRPLRDVQGVQELSTNGDKSERGGQIRIFGTRIDILRFSSLRLLYDRQDDLLLLCLEYLRQK